MSDFDLTTIQADAAYSLVEIVGEQCELCEKVLPKESEFCMCAECIEVFRSALNEPVVRVIEDKE